MTIYELTANLRPGRNTFTWHPRVDRGAHLPRPDHGDRRRRQPPHLRRGQRSDGPQAHVGGRARARRRRGLHAESYVAPSSARLAIETDATSLTLQTFRAGPRGHATHSDTLMNGVAVNQPVTIPWIARHRRATLNFAIGPWPTGRLLRQADGQRRPHRLRALRRPADGARRAEPRRRRDADEHVAGIQLPRRGRQRLGRHVVREGRPEHRRARPDVHPPRRAAAVAQVRRRLHPLAARDRQAAGLPDRDRARGRSAPPRS